MERKRLSWIPIRQPEQCAQVRALLVLGEMPREFRPKLGWRGCLVDGN